MMSISIKAENDGELDRAIENITFVLQSTHRKLINNPKIRMEFKLEHRDKPDPPEPEEPDEDEENTDGDNARETPG